VNAALIAVALSDTIQRFGSYAGLASVVGLGVLSLLYFAQAREVKRLREWAGRAPERAVELEQRVQADAQRRVVAQPLSPATTAAQKAEAARTAAAAALYAKVPPPPPPPAPLVGPPGQLARPALPGTVPAAGPAGTASGEGAVATPTPPPGSFPDATTPGTGEPAVPPATPAAAARQAAVPSRAPSAHDNGNGGQETRESAAARPDPPADLPAPPSTVAGLAGLPGDDDDNGDMSTGRIAAIVVGALVAVVAVVVVMVVLNSGDNAATKPNDFGSVTQSAAAGTQPGSSTNSSAATPGLDRRATRVAVLNGTTQTGLARAVADKIEQARFTIAGTENNADQAVPTTTVSYRGGNQRAAQIVAQVIGIDSASVQAVDANTSAAADADVVVIVGADKIG
jgi:LytR cell envelope-related transcriptional attenuator